MSREAMQMALEALEKVITAFGPGLTLQQKAAAALRQALDVNMSEERVDETVKSEHEPVAWANSYDLQNFDMKVRTGPDLHHTVPLYTAPPKRTWVGLTDEEVEDIYFDKFSMSELVGFARYIEQALKDKNGGEYRNKATTERTKTKEMNT